MVTPAAASAAFACGTVAESAKATRTRLRVTSTPSSGWVTCGASGGSVSGSAELADVNASPAKVRSPTVITASCATGASSLAVHEPVDGNVKTYRCPTGTGPESNEPSPELTVRVAPAALVTTIV